MLSRVITFLFAAVAISGSSPAIAARRETATPAAHMAQEIVRRPRLAAVRLTSHNPEPAASVPAPATDSVLRAPERVRGVRLDQRVVRHGVSTHARVAGPLRALGASTYVDSRSGESRTSAWSLAQRGYRATGPPMGNESLQLKDSSASRL